MCKKVKLYKLDWDAQFTLGGSLVYTKDRGDGMMCWVTWDNCMGEQQRASMSMYEEVLPV